MSAYILIQSAGKEYFEAPHNRILSASPLAVLDELNRIYAANITKPEPGRLEIAAMIYAANIAHHGICLRAGESPKEAAFRKADALIAEARKEVAK
jgi:hypothetical protein